MYEKQKNIQKIIGMGLENLVVDINIFQEDGHQLKN